MSYTGQVWTGVARALGPRPEGCSECSPTGEPAVQIPSPPRRGRAGSKGAPGPGGLLVTTRHFRGATGLLCFDSCRSTLGKGPDRRKTGSEWVINRPQKRMDVVHSPVGGP